MLMMCDFPASQVWLAEGKSSSQINLIIIPLESYMIHHFSCLNEYSTNIPRIFHKTRLFHYITITGWWFGTFFIFPYIGNNHPNWLFFFRGVQTTNQHYINPILFCSSLNMCPGYSKFTLQISDVAGWFSQSLQLIHIKPPEGWRGSTYYYIPSGNSTVCYWKWPFIVKMAQSK